jgi:hypothetical protein
VSRLEAFTVRCATCPTETTTLKRLEDELPEWQCRPCQREERDLFYADYDFERSFS